MAAKTLISNIRPFDTASRYGGEEFVVTIQNVNRKELFSVAEKLRVLIEKSMFFIRGIKINVTVSIGAALIKKGDTIKSAINRSDKLMYKSKLAGKNRVTIE